GVSGPPGAAKDGPPGPLAVHDVIENAVERHDGRRHAQSINPLVQVRVGGVQVKLLAQSHAEGGRFCLLIELGHDRMASDLWAERILPHPEHKIQCTEAARQTRPRYWPRRLRQGAGAQFGLASAEMVWVRCSSLTASSVRPSWRRA